MKKNIFLSLFLAIVTLFNCFACSSPPTGLFDADYKFIDSTALNKLTNDINSAEYGNSVDYGKGYLIEMSLSATTHGSEHTVSFSLKTKDVDGEFRAIGTYAKVKDGVTTKRNVYFADGVVYVDETITQNGEETKDKYTITETFIAYLYSATESAINFASPLAMIELKNQFTDATISVEFGETLTKAKIAKVNKVATEPTFNTYFVFDLSYELIAVKVCFNLTQANSRSDTTLTITDYKGTISKPNNLSEYL